MAYNKLLESFIMPYYSIKGGQSLNGEVEISPSKNSVLPIMCASLMLQGKTLIKSCPALGDVIVLSDILKGLGARLEQSEQGLLIDSAGVNNYMIDGVLAGKIRASFFMVGALLSRFKRAVCPMPGGCKIGVRPVDIHLDGLRALGVEITERDGVLYFNGEGARPCKYRMRYPSVGATENLIMASVLLKGTTYLHNCATEPEIKDLTDFLNLAGAKIYGGGTRYIRIEGVPNLKGQLEYKPIPDRIETGTFLLGAYLLGGRVWLKGAKKENIFYLIKNNCNNTCKNTPFNVNIYNEGIYIESDGNPQAFNELICAPYPLFPTDLHPLVGAVAAAASGVTKITETVFDSRFLYVEQLKKMGAKITLDGLTATIHGTKLNGATVEATDLRGGAALTLAGLKATGCTKVYGVEHIMRGYLDFDLKLKGLGADITLIN